MSVQTAIVIQLPAGQALVRVHGVVLDEGEVSVDLREEPEHGWFPHQDYEVRQERPTPTQRELLDDAHDALEEQYAPDGSPLVDNQWEPF